MWGKNKRPFSPTLLRSPHDDEPNFFKSHPKVLRARWNGSSFPRMDTREEVEVVILRLYGVYWLPGYHDVYGSGWEYCLV